MVCRIVLEMLKRSVKLRKTVAGFVIAGSRAVGAFRMGRREEEESKRGKSVLDDEQSAMTRFAVLDLLQRWI